MVAPAIRPGRLPPLATSSEELARRCARHLDERGLRPAFLLRAHGLWFDKERDPNARIPVPKEEALLRGAGRVADDPYLGWRVGAAELRDLGLFGYSVLNAGTVGEALTIASERHALLSDSALSTLHVAGGEAILARPLSTGSATDQVALRRFLAHLRELAGPDVRPIRLALPETEGTRLDGLRTLAGLPIEAAAAPMTFVTFDARHLERPLHGADARLAATLTRLWTSECVLHARRHAALRRLQDAIVPLLPYGAPGLDEVAGALGVSKRALRNDLDRLGLGLGELIDGLRQDLAETILTDGRMSEERAARALGFAEPGMLVLLRRAERGRSGNDDTPTDQQDRRA